MRVRITPVCVCVFPLAAVSGWAPSRRQSVASCPNITSRRPRDGARREREREKPRPGRSHTQKRDRERARRPLAVIGQIKKVTGRRLVAPIHPRSLSGAAVQRTHRPGNIADYGSNCFLMPVVYNRYRTEPTGWSIAFAVKAKRGQSGLRERVSLIARQLRPALNKDQGR